MDIRIGVTDAPREISVQLADNTDRNTLKSSIEAALSGSSAILWITDDKGREVAVASARIAYVDLGPEGSRPIGFS